MFLQFYRVFYLAELKNYTFILLFLPFICFSQKDSLKSIIAKANQPDSVYFDALIKLSDLYSYQNPDSAIYYAEEAKKIATKQGNDNHIVQSDVEIGWNLYILGKYSEAITMFNRALDRSIKTKNSRGVAVSYGNLGTVYKDLGNLKEALDCYFKLLKFSEESGSKKLQATALGNMGLVYMMLENFDKAREYFSKALLLDIELKNDRGVGRHYGNLALLKERNSQYDSAFYYHKKALAIDKKLNNKLGMARHYGNIGQCYYLISQYDSAKHYFFKALELDKLLDNKNGIGDQYNRIGSLFATLNEFKKSEKYLLEALKISQEINNTEIKKNSEMSLSELYYKTKDFKKSVDYYHRYIQTLEKLKNEEVTKSSVQKEMEYSYMKKMAADSIANLKEQEIKDNQIAKQKAEISAKRSQQYALFGGLILVIIFSVFLYNRFKVTNRQKLVIEEKNKEITDSISYAKRIQTAILPPSKLVKEYLSNSFILYKPKDIVAGDFYWMEHKDGKVLFAAADCTGHGVPGAMVSVICNNGLNRSVREYNLTEPGKILDKTREIVIQEFEKSEDEVKDGMDIALCSLAVSSSSEAYRELQYAGANNPLWIIRNNTNEIEEIKATKQPIGKYANPEPYITHSIELQKGDSIYIFSDGYADQFGGEKGKKFKGANFKKLLLSIQHETMEKQKELINEAFENWRGELEQIDDICVIGVKL